MSGDREATRRRRASIPAIAAVVALGFTLRGTLGVGAAHLAVPPAVGCSEEPAVKPSSAPPVVIGVSLALGDSFGLGLKNAIVVAEGLLNANGGLLGRSVRFKVVDDKGDEGEVLTGVADSLVRDGVAAVIGPIGSDQVLQTQAIYAKRSIIQIAPGATAPALTSAQSSEDRFLFRTTPADDIQGRAVVLFARTGGSAAGPDAGANSPAVGQCSRMAIFNLSNTYGVAMADAVEKLFQARGGSVVTRVAVESVLAASYEKEVASVLSAAPECVALIAFSDVGARFMIDLRSSALYPKLPPGFFVVGTDGVYTQDFIDLTQLDRADAGSTVYAEGTFGTTPDTNPVARREYQQFRTLYRSYFPGEEPGAFAANTFDAAILTALAIARAKTSARGDAIRDALKEVSRAPGRSYGPAELREALLAVQEGDDIDYNGASGRVDFDDDGNVLGDFILWTVARDPKTGTAGFQTLKTISADDLRAF